MTQFYSCFWLADTIIYWSLIGWLLQRKEFSQELRSGATLCQYSGAGEYLILIGWHTKILISDWLQELCSRIIEWVQMWFLIPSLLTSTTSAKTSQGMIRVRWEPQRKVEIFLVASQDLFYSCSTSQRMQELRLMQWSYTYRMAKIKSAESA